MLDAALDAAQEALAEVRGESRAAEPGAEPAPASDGGGASGGASGVGADGWLDDERVVALTRALQIPVVRDAAVAACTGSRPAAAEALWAALARGTPDPEAAEPAALLALMGLLRGDGALANVALRRAESAWPGHHFTETLRGLAAAGIRPSELRACLTGVPVPHRDRQRSSASARTSTSRAPSDPATQAPPMTVATTDPRRRRSADGLRRGAGRRDGRQRGHRPHDPSAGPVCGWIRRRGGAG